MKEEAREYLALCKLNIQELEMYEKVMRLERNKRLQK